MLPVKTAPVVRGDLVIRLTSPGEVFASRRAVIKAEVSGALKEVAAEEGRAVAAGAVLARIDERPYALRLESAEAERLKNLSEMLVENHFGDVERRVDPGIEERIRTSPRRSRRVSRAFAAGVIGREDYDRVRKAHESLLIETGRKKDEVQAASKGLTRAKVGVAVARLDLGEDRVRAPFSGVLTDIKVSVGETGPTARTS